MRISHDLENWVEKEYFSNLNGKNDTILSHFWRKNDILLPLSLQKLILKLCKIKFVIESSTEKRIWQELRDFVNDPPCVCSAGPMDPKNIFIWEGTILGPYDTPYDGGVFFVRIIFPDNYPFKPLQVTFDTKIYHCCVHERGFICLKQLRSQWAPNVTISQIFKAIVAMLKEPDVGK